jgi:UDP-glucuronate 4-epimerase
VKVLVTGGRASSAFIRAKRLLERGDSVLGFDDVNAYYSPELKERRLALLAEAARAAKAPWDFVRANLVDQKAVKRTFSEHQFDRVIHLAAQAGVRHSLTHPHTYVESNITGFLNILEACGYSATPHLTYASTSSVYGADTKMPFRHPLQLYAATKRANELMAHVYSHLFRLPTTGLRFFTVYSPWGGPTWRSFCSLRRSWRGRQ